LFTVLIKTNVKQLSVHSRQSHTGSVVILIYALVTTLRMIMCQEDLCKLVQ